MTTHRWDIFLLGSLLAMGSAAAETFSTELHLTLRVQNYAHVPGGILDRAKTIAANIFREAGIETVWIDCPTNAAELNLFPACWTPMGPHDLVLRIHPRKPAELAMAGDVAGLAILSETGGFARMASIFYDRVNQLTWDVRRTSTQGIFVNTIGTDLCTGTTLGLVMTHEVGHLLLGSDSHADRGVMRASFNLNTLEQTYRGIVRFTPDQARRLRSASEARIRAASSSRASR